MECGRPIARNVGQGGPFLFDPCRLSSFRLFINWEEGPKRLFAEVARIVEATVLVEGRDGGHLLVGQSEIEQGEVLTQPFRS